MNDFIEPFRPAGSFACILDIICIYIYETHCGSIYTYNIIYINLFR